MPSSVAETKGFSSQNSLPGSARERHKNLMFVQAQSVYVSAAHRYWNFQWDESRNLEVYGRLASKEGLGSNFRLEVGVELSEKSEIDLAPALAFVKGLADHRCFFTDVEAFASSPSTLETLTRYLGLELFRTNLPSGRWSHFTMAENPHLSCTVRPGVEPVEMRIGVLNLELTLQRAIERDSGLALDRQEVWAAVRAVAPNFAQPATGSQEAWAESLSLALKAKVKGLTELRIDLGSQRFLRVRS